MLLKRDRFPQEGVCFVIMPFGKKELGDGKAAFDFDRLYENVFKPAIEDAGMHAVRADNIFGAGPLMERVWAGIQEAEIIVADLTGKSPNVLYELGLSHVIAKRVILCTMDPEDVPTDLAQEVTLRYSRDDGVSIASLGRDLTANIKAARAEAKPEMNLVPLFDRTRVSPVPGQVIAVEADYAIIRAADGRKAFLSGEDVSWTRLFKDLRKRFEVGQFLNGAFVRERDGNLKYSLIAMEEDPWPKLRSAFPVGKSFEGNVVSRLPGIGAFVAMEHGVNGFIPETAIPYSQALERGMKVEVTTSEIDPENRRVTLRIEKIMSQGAHELPSRGDAGNDFEPGERFQGIVCHISERKDYVLVTRKNAHTHSQAAILHQNHMSADFQQQLDWGNIQNGYEVWVEVLSATTGRTELKDTGPTANSQPEAEGDLELEEAA